MVQLFKCKDKRAFEEWRSRLGFNLTQYENQTRCFYKVYACSEVSHRAPDWGPKKKNKPLCGERLRLMPVPWTRGQVCSFVRDAWTATGIPWKTTS